MLTLPCAAVLCERRVNHTHMAGVGQSAFSYLMMRDEEMPGTIVRSSFIPEELGRIDYLLSDKTGTLTQNVMEMKEIHMGDISFGREGLEEVRRMLKESYLSPAAARAPQGPARTRLPAEMMVRRLIEGLALCHNVNVTVEGEEKVYQASSPDEVALVQYARATGLVLTDRSTTKMVLTRPSGERAEYQILYLFPFSSDTKRMGIIVRFRDTRAHEHTHTRAHARTHTRAHTHTRWPLSRVSLHPKHQAAP